MNIVDISIKWIIRKWKTNFSLEILKNSNCIFDTASTGLIIIYREFQEIYNKFQKFIPTQLIDETDT